jgi:hypothetical protein
LFGSWCNATSPAFRHYLTQARTLLRRTANACTPEPTYFSAPVAPAHAGMCVPRFHLEQRMLFFLTQAKPFQFAGSIANDYLMDSFLKFVT